LCPVQQAAGTGGLLPSIGCDWLQVASSRMLYAHNTMLMKAASVAGVVASFIAVVIAVRGTTGWS